MWYDLIEDGEVDLEPGWDNAPLPPPIAPPMRDLDLPDLALSGVNTGVPELFRPGRAKKKKENIARPSLIRFDDQSKVVNKCLTE